MANGSTRFYKAIFVNDGIHDVSIQNVTLSSANRTAGMRAEHMRKQHHRFGRGPDPMGWDQNGYVVEEGGGNGTIEFRLATASVNTEDGFAIERTPDIGRVKFPGAQSIVWFGSGELHIENSHVVDNEGVGIHGGNSDLRVTTNTVDCAHHQQLATPVSPVIQIFFMNEVTIRELRNHGARVLDRVASGEVLTVTRDGHPIAELRPLPPRPMSSATLLSRWRALPAIDAAKLRADIDAVLDSCL